MLILCHLSILYPFFVTLSHAAKDDAENGIENEKIGIVEKQLHFIGSLPFANMIMGMNISQSLLLTDISDARTADSDTYELSKQDQEIIEDSEISLSDRVPMNILGNVLSSEDMIVTRSNALLIARRKEDELRTQLAGKSRTHIYMPSPSHFYCHYHYHPHLCPYHFLSHQFCLYLYPYPFSHLLNLCIT
jgi:hypothetical protein